MRKKIKKVRTMQGDHLHVTDQSKYKLSPDLTNNQSTNKRNPNFNIFVLTIANCGLTYLHYSWPTKIQRNNFKIKGMRRRVWQWVIVYLWVWTSPSYRSNRVELDCSDENKYAGWKMCACDTYMLNFIMIKFGYNARCQRLKENALSEYKA